MSDVTPIKNESILKSIKELLGVDTEYTVFDSEIIAGINTSLFTLKQVGVKGGTINGVTETWADVLEHQDDLDAIKTYIHLNTKLLFDPPSTSFVINAYEEMKKELLVRLNVFEENREVEK